MDTNPYSAPSSSVDSPTEPQNFELHDPRTVSVGRGISWIGEGFDHFKKDPGPWILICIVGLVVMIVLNVIPFVNLLAGLFTYVWLAGLMLGCKAQDDGGSITVGHLFAGFQDKLGPLILLGLIIVIISIAIMFVAMGSTYFQLIGLGIGGGPEDLSAATDDIVGDFVLPFLIAMLFLLPLGMAAWFAPTLIVLNNVPVFKAMSMSFMGCLKNFVPFLLYGIVLLILYIIAAIPLLLGLLVLMPTFFGSMYRSYKDIFIDI